MTLEQAAKLRRGDEISVRAVVVSIDLTHPQYPICVSVDESDDICVAPVCILSILRRQLSVGDTVKVPGSYLTGEIIAVDDGYAWVRWPAGDRTSELLSDLTPVEGAAK